MSSVHPYVCQKALAECVAGSFAVFIVSPGQALLVCEFSICIANELCHE